MAARLLTRRRHWRRVGPRAATGDDLQAGRSGSSPSPLPVRTGGEKQRHLQSNKIATTICFSFPFLSSVPSLLSLSDLSLVLPLHDSLRLQGEGGGCCARPRWVQPGLDCGCRRGIEGRRRGLPLSSAWGRESGLSCGSVGDGGEAVEAGQRLEKGKMEAERLGEGAAVGRRKEICRSREGGSGSVRGWKRREDRLFGREPAAKMEACVGGWEKGKDGEGRRKMEVDGCVSKWSRWAGRGGVVAGLVGEERAGSEGKIFNRGVGGAAAALEEKEIRFFFRVRFFCIFFWFCQNCPPLLGWKWRLFIGKIVFSGFKIGPSSFVFGPWFQSIHLVKIKLGIVKFWFFN